ncbi:Forkhead-associated protein [Thalassoporum mexicanum PCC 7367]|uniref:FHA domain-containing protein n=1 Tax=Thalassoporum mexicanum TaxID=3457544 RepID=UPI00029FD517|nr:FHA domain-containing protein [Pseudanabaena sp. PCC 7367]AFY70951.1 Forkhead-associated protein [Pseudanabaena sp. PCC 7367]
MITINLLHPVNSNPVQTWRFSSKDVIRIGRSKDNSVVVLSSVVSRHHAELRRQKIGWEVHSFGANGTYVEGKQVTQAKIVDGTVIRLANSGPRIQVRLDADESSPKVELESEMIDALDEMELSEEEQANQNPNERPTLTNI